MSAFAFHVVASTPDVGNIHLAFIQHIDVYMENMCATPEDLYTWLSNYVAAKQRMELEDLRETVSMLREDLRDHTNTKVGGLDICGNPTHS